MGIELGVLELRLRAYLQLPIILERLGNADYSARPDIFERSHGFRLLFDCVFQSKVSCRLDLDQYGSDIVNAWSCHYSETAEAAFGFYSACCPSGAIEMNVNGAVVKSADDLRALSARNWKPAEVSLKAYSRAEEDDGEPDLLFRSMLAALGFSLILANILSPFENEPDGFEEGSLKVTELSYHERSRANRLNCIAHHGCNCAVCGMSFEDVYGDYATGFIHVHHINPVSELDESVVVDPKTDLVPLCPNCHAAIHLHNPLITPDELKRRLNSERDQ